MSMQLRTVKKQKTKGIESGVSSSNNIEQEALSKNSYNKEILEKEAAGSSAEIKNFNFLY